MNKIAFCLAFTLLSFAGLSQSAEVEYLKNNRIEVSLESPGQINFPDKEFYAHQIFLFGENHGSAQPHEFDVLFFKHLYFKERVRIYIAEVDCIKALMLNNYLKDGKEDWLLKVFQSWKEEGAQWANKSNFKKYQQLYFFYQTLPKAEKFTIVGIDVIQDYGLVREYLKLLTGKKTTNIANINKLISIADTIQYTNRKILGQLAREISDELTVNRNYARKFEKNLTAFHLFIKNAGYVGNGMTRDSIMFRSFKDNVKAYKLQNKKMYGFLGFFHTLQCKYEVMPFAGFLKANEPTLRIVSLQMLALQSKVLLPYSDQLKKIMPVPYVNELRKASPEFPLTERYVPYILSNDDPMMKVDGIEDLKNTSGEKSIYLFRLNGRGTPFAKNKKLAEVSGFQSLKMKDPTGVTIDAFQYVVLFRNSPAALPLDK